MRKGKTWRVRPRDSSGGIYKRSTATAVSRQINAHCCSVGATTIVTAGCTLLSFVFVFVIQKWWIIPTKFSQEYTAVMDVTVRITDKRKSASDAENEDDFEFKPNTRFVNRSLFDNKCHVLCWHLQYRIGVLKLLHSRPKCI